MIVSLKIATILQIINLKVHGHFRWRNIVLQLGQPALQDSSRVLIVQYLIEVGDAARSVCWCVVRQADVEEAGVLECNKLVHVVSRGAHEKQVISSQ